MIADPTTPFPAHPVAPDSEDRLHMRAFRSLVQELARLVARLEEGRQDTTSQLLTPAAAEILRQLAPRRSMPLASLRVGHAAPTPAQLGILTGAGLVEVQSADVEHGSPQVRLTATGEFQVLLMDLPGLLRMARSSIGLTVEQLEVTTHSLRALRQALDHSGRTMRLVP
jgi:hypothetical protein